MTSVIIGVFLLLGWLAWLHISAASQARGQAEMALLALAESALNTLKAQNLAEKAHAEYMKKNYDVQLDYLRDTMAKAEAAPAKVPAPSSAPNYVKIYDQENQTKTVDLNQFEVLD